MTNTIGFLLTSQPESSLKNKNGIIERRNKKKSDNQQLFYYLNSQKKKHEDGKVVRNGIEALCPNRLRIAKVFLSLVGESPTDYSNKSLEYLAGVCATSKKTMSRVIIDLEKLGLIEVCQKVKKTSSYSFSLLLRDEVIIGYLRGFFPSLAKLLPFVFSLVFLLSVATDAPREEKEESGRQSSPDLIFLTKKKKSYTKKESMKIEIEEVDEFSRAFVYDDYRPLAKSPSYPPKSPIAYRQVSEYRQNRYVPSSQQGEYSGPKYITCCEFKKMKNSTRKAYMHKYRICFKDTDRGYEPTSEGMKLMLLCNKKETCCD